MTGTFTCPRCGEKQYGVPCELTEHDSIQPTFDVTIRQCCVCQHDLCEECPQVHCDCGDYRCLKCSVTVPAEGYENDPMCPICAGEVIADLKAEAAYEDAINEADTNECRCPVRE